MKYKAPNSFSLLSWVVFFFALKALLDLLVPVARILRHQLWDQALTPRPQGGGTHAIVPPVGVTGLIYEPYHLLKEPAMLAVLIVLIWFLLIKFLVHFSIPRQAQMVADTVASWHVAYENNPTSVLSDPDLQKDMNAFLKHAKTAESKLSKDHSLLPVFLYDYARHSAVIYRTAYQSLHELIRESGRRKVDQPKVEQQQSA